MKESVSGQRLGSFAHHGRRVAFAVVGQGPPLVCDLGRLHHLDVFWRHPPYRALVEALARSFTVIRFDRPGCGLSDRAAADFTLGGELALFDRLVEALGLDRPAVLAWASSVPVAVAVAALRPARMSRLALFDAATRPWQEAAGYLDALGALLETQRELATELLAQRIAAGCDAGATRWLAGAYRQVASGPVIASWLRDAAVLDVRSLLGRVGCPALVLHRSGDRLADLQHARDVAAGIPGAMLVPLDGAASVIWEGDMDAVLGPLLRFLEGAGDPDRVRAAAPLTARERQVAALVAGGHTNAAIGERLGISRRTVESHLERARARLGLTSRTDVAAWAARRGLDAPAR